MTQISRRGFLATGAGVTAAGVAAVTLPKLAGSDLGAAPAIGAGVSAGATSTAAFSGDISTDAPGTGSYVVSIRDASKGEITVMNGETEYVIQDRALVSRVVAAASGSGK